MSDATLPQCSLVVAIDDLFGAISHVFGHCLNEHKQGQFAGRRTLMFNDDHQSITVHYDSTSLNVTSMRGENTMTVTVGSWEYEQELLTVVE